MTVESPPPLIESVIYNESSFEQNNKHITKLNVWSSKIRPNRRRRYINCTISFIQLKILSTVTPFKCTGDLFYFIEPVSCYNICSYLFVKWLVICSHSSRTLIFFSLNEIMNWCPIVVFYSCNFCSQIPSKYYNTILILLKKLNFAIIVDSSVLLFGLLSFLFSHLAQAMYHPRQSCKENKTKQIAHECNEFYVLYVDIFFESHLLLSMQNVK